MHNSILTRSLAGLAIASGAVLLSANPAGAHVGIEQSEVSAGSSTVLNFTVPHGCDGSDTTAIAIRMPESIVTVTPNRNPFYDVSIETETLETPVEGSHGEQITERDAVVTFTAREPLPDGQRDVLGVSMRIPDDAAGDVLYFPTVQTCEEGDTAWIEIPDDGVDPHSLDAPAPSVNVVAGSSDDGHGHSDDAPSEEATSSGDDDGTDSLTIVAMALAVAALGLGGAALATARSGGSKP